MKNLFLLFLVLISKPSFADFDLGKYFQGRATVGAGIGHLTNSFEKRERYTAGGAHADLQAELGPVLIGFSVMGMESKTQYKSNGVVVYAPYVGARLLGSIDLISGIAFGEAKYSRNGWAATPEYKVERSAIASGGYFGIRIHFGKSKEHIGLAVTGYNISSDDYNMTKTDYSLVETKSKVTEKGSHFGGMITLFFTGGTGKSSGGKGK